MEGKHILRNGDELIITQSKPESVTEVLAYLQEIGGETDYLSFGMGEFEYTEEEERKILKEFSDAKNQLHIIARINGKIVAMLDVRASHKPRLEHVGEFGISVMRAHWGKGVASAIINYMISWARSTGVLKKLSLKVASNNDHAINLYRKFQFSMEGRLAKEFFVNDQYYDMIIMGYWLD